MLISSIESSRWKNEFAVSQSLSFFGRFIPVFRFACSLTIFSSIVISFCWSVRLFEFISLSTSLQSVFIVRHDLWWALSPRKPLHFFPHAHLISSVLAGTLLSLILLFKLKRSCGRWLFPLVTWFREAPWRNFRLHLQVWRPSKIKSSPQNEQTAKTESVKIINFDTMVIAVLPLMTHRDSQQWIPGQWW